MVKQDLIYIEWVDAMQTSDGAWYTFEEASDWARSKRWVVQSVGWVLEETGKYLLMCAKANRVGDEDEEQYGLLLKIPKTWIIKRHSLKEGGVDNARTL